MRKPLCLFFVVLVVQWNATGHERDSLAVKQELGVVITEFINGAFQFKYERKFSRNFSYGIGLGLKGKNGLLRLSGIDTESVKTSDITYSGFKVIPEIRYYITNTQQGELDGFYIGSYLKHSQYQSRLFGTYINSTDETYLVDSDAKMIITSMGLMIGYKLPVAKRLHLDFTILGAGAGHHRYSLQNNLALPDEFYDDIQFALQELSLYDLLQSDVRMDWKDAKANFTIPAIRYGIALGYTF